MTVHALHPSPDYVSDFIRAAGHPYEFVVLHHLTQRLRDVESGVIVDVGAMIGNHSQFLAEQLPAFTIHAFEPWPPSRDLLRINCAGQNVTVHPYALSDWTGESFMRAEPGNIGHAYLTDAGLKVKVRTLDSFHFRDLRLIKIDVEGWEPNVLRGAWATINQWHPLIALEDWTGGNYGGGLPEGYALADEWATQHQVYLYEWRP